MEYTYSMDGVAWNTTDYIMEYDAIYWTMCGTTQNTMTYTWYMHDITWDAMEFN